MSEVLAYYQQQAQQQISTLPWLAQLQTKALKDLKRFGFPSRHDEEWKYTVVDALLKQPFAPATAETQTDRMPESDLPLTHYVLMHNGQLVYRSPALSQLPSTVIVCSLAEAIAKHSALVTPYLSRILPIHHGFQALNTAMLMAGVFIYIPKGLSISDPIAIVHQHNKQQQAVYLRHLIVAEDNASATVVEEYQGEAGHCYVTNTATEIMVGTQATLTHYKIQRESKAAFHLGDLAVRQAANSAFNSHVLSIGARLARSDLHIALREEKAHCLMNGIYAPGEGQHLDQHTRVEHLVANCSSEQDYKGILNGHSRAVFNGKVVVAQDAQHSDAKQQNKNLLLSTHAEIDTKPQLEIYADDVVCAHGATVGQLDEEALFYLATRGIDRLEASRYLIHAFAQDNLQLLQHSGLRAWMRQLLTEQLES